MSLVGHKKTPFKHIGHCILNQSLENVWSIIKDPMSLYSFFLSFHNSKANQLRPSFPLLYDLFEINNFSYGKNFNLLINIKNTIETDYCCRSCFVLREKEFIRSVLTLGLHYVDSNKSYCSFIYANYSCENYRENSFKVLSILQSITSVNSISSPLMYNSQIERKIINANFNLALKFFTNIAICTNLLGELKQGTGKELREGTIIESKVDSINKDLILQVKTVKIKANMFDLVVFVYEKASPFPQRKFIVRLNNINNEQTYVVFITQFFRKRNERENKILGERKRYVLKKLAAIIEKINEKNRNNVNS